MVPGLLMRLTESTVNVEKVKRTDNEDAHDIYSSVEVFFCFVLFHFLFQE